MPKLLFVIKWSKKSLKYDSHKPRPTHILYQCAKHVKALCTHFSIFLASEVCPMLKYSDIYDIWKAHNYCNIQWIITNFGIHTPGRSMYSGYKCNVHKWHHGSSVDIGPNNSMAYISKTGSTISFKYFSWEPLG